MLLKYVSSDSNNRRLFTFYNYDNNPRAFLDNRLTIMKNIKNPDVILIIILNPCAVLLSFVLLSKSFKYLAKVPVKIVDMNIFITSNIKNNLEYQFY